MGKLFGLIHTFIIGYIVLTGNDVYDWALGGIIAVMGYIYAFRFTGGIADSVGYNSALMSLIHWTFRTFIVAIIITVTRIAYVTLVTIVVDEVLSVAICVICLIIIAEILKVMTNLNKNYW